MRPDGGREGRGDRGRRQADAGGGRGRGWQGSRWATRRMSEGVREGQAWEYNARLGDNLPATQIKTIRVHALPCGAWTRSTPIYVVKITCVSLLAMMLERTGAYHDLYRCIREKRSTRIRTLIPGISQQIVSRCVMRYSVQRRRKFWSLWIHKTSQDIQSSVH
eukprot:767726-Hanusia_phi.AAC.9